MALSDFVQAFGSSAEKDSFAHRLAFVYLYVVSGCGAVWLLDYSGLVLPYHPYARGVVFLLGVVLSVVSVAYIINAEYAEWAEYHDVDTSSE